jgi:hypothetical protein
MKLGQVLGLSTVLLMPVSAMAQPTYSCSAWPSTYQALQFVNSLPSSVATTCQVIPNIAWEMAVNRWCSDGWSGMDGVEDDDGPPWDIEALCQEGFPIDGPFDLWCRGRLSVPSGANACVDVELGSGLEGTPF